VSPDDEANWFAQADAKFNKDPDATPGAAPARPAVRPAPTAAQAAPAPAAAAPAASPKTAEPAVARQERENEEARARKQALAEQAAKDGKARAEAEAAAAAAKARADAEARQREAEAKAQVDAEHARVERERRAKAEADTRHTAKLARVEGTSGRRRRIREVGFKQLPEVSRVFVRVSEVPRYTIAEAGERLIRVELQNTVVARPNDARALDTSYFASAVAGISPKRHGTSTVLEIALKEKVAFQQRLEGDTLSIDFERPGAERAAEPAPAPGSEAPAR
jgi:hypothetical protein